jgi:DNA-binding beta-propeller fold protein YncE
MTMGANTMRIGGNILSIRDKVVNQYKKVAVSQYPQGVAYDTVEKNKFYNTGYYDQAITVYDATTFELLATIPTGTLYNVKVDPIDANNRFITCADGNHNGFRVYDTVSYAKTYGSFLAGLTTPFNGVAFDPIASNNRIIASDTAGNMWEVFESISGALDWSLGRQITDLVPFGGPISITFDPNPLNNRFFCPAYDRILVFDATTLLVIDTITVTGNALFTVIFDPIEANKKFYCCGANKIRIFDSETFAVLQTIPATGAYFGDADPNTNRKRLLITDGGNYKTYTIEFTFD